MYANPAARPHQSKLPDLEPVPGVLNSAAMLQLFQHRKAGIRTENTAEASAEGANANLLSACFNPCNGFFHHGRFTCARAATNAVTRSVSANVKDRFTLLAGKSLVLKSVYPALNGLNFPRPL